MRNFLIIIFILLISAGFYFHKKNSDYLSEANSFKKVNFSERKEVLIKKIESDEITDSSTQGNNLITSPETMQVDKNEREPIQDNKRFDQINDLEKERLLNELDSFSDAQNDTEDDQLDEEENQFNMPIQQSDNGDD